MATLALWLTPGRPDGTLGHRAQGKGEGMAGVTGLQHLRTRSGFHVGRSETLLGVAQRSILLSCWRWRADE